MYSHSFIHSFIQTTTTQKRSQHNTDTVSEFHAEAPQWQSGTEAKAPTQTAIKSFSSKYYN